jgi:ABC-type glycerol-3-phosphate transport system permease component
VIETQAGSTSLARARVDIFVVRRWIGRGILYVILTIGMVVFALPFIWMVSTSIKPGPEVYLIPPKWIPSTFEWANFVEPWQNLPFLIFYKNTVLVTGLSILGTLLSASMAAFAFARLRFRGRNLLFLLVLSTLILPQQVTLVPQYIFFTNLKLVNTIWPLIIPYFFSALGGAFNIFLLRQYMMTIPLELDDAARLDGCGWLDLYWRIIIPLSSPALGVVAIFAFRYHWTEYFHPLIYLNTRENFTVSLGLQLLNSRYVTQVQQTMAMTLISVIPLLVIFFIAQARYIQGITITGVKG